jgi:hypothetical protein
MHPRVCPFSSEQNQDETLLFHATASAGIIMILNAISSYFKKKVYDPDSWGGGGGRVETPKTGNATPAAIFNNQYDR